MPVEVEKKRTSSMKPPTGPLDSETPVSQAEPEPEPVTPSMLWRSVFIVEDEVAHRDYLEKLMQQLDYETLTAADGQDAQEQAAAFQASPLLIYVDMTLPDLDANELILILRAWFKPAKIIAMMSLSDEGLIETAFESGCDTCLIKPGGFKELPRYLELLEKDATALDQLVFDENGAYFRE